MRAEDSLDAIVGRCQPERTPGPNRSGVTASILTRGTDAYSVVLTSDATGAEGISLADGIRREP